MTEEMDADAVMQNIEIIGLDPCVTQALKKTASIPRRLVLSELSDIDIDLLQDSRTLLFTRACENYQKQLSDNHITDQIVLESKARRIKDTVSSDIIDLYLYVLGVRLDFPRAALKNVTVFRDIPDLVDENKDDIDKD